MLRSLLASFALAVLTACGGSTCPEPFYDGKASDEAWRTMVDAEARAKTDSTKTVTLFFPAEGERIPPGNAPTFKWSTPLTASAVPLPRHKQPMLSRIGGWIYGSAWAHLPPITGPLHVLRIKIPRRTCPLELVTTRTEWIPSAEAWTQLKASGGESLSLDVFSAYVQDTRITEGPFHFNVPLTFSVGP